MTVLNPSFLSALLDKPCSLDIFLVLKFEKSTLRHVTKSDHGEENYGYILVSKYLFDKKIKSKNENDYNSHEMKLTPNYLVLE